MVHPCDGFYADIKKTFQTKFLVTRNMLKMLTIKLSNLIFKSKIPNSMNRIILILLKHLTAYKNARHTRKC